MRQQSCLETRTWATQHMETRYFIRKQNSLIQQILVAIQESISAPEAVTHVPECFCLGDTWPYGLPCYLWWQPQE